MRCSLKASLHSFASHASVRLLSSAWSSASCRQLAASWPCNTARVTAAMTIDAYASTTSAMSLEGRAQEHARPRAPGISGQPRARGVQRQLRVADGGGLGGAGERCAGDATAEAASGGAQEGRTAADEEQGGQEQSHDGITDTASRVLGDARHGPRGVCTSLDGRAGHAVASPVRNRLACYSAPAAQPSRPTPATAEFMPAVA